MRPLEMPPDALFRRAVASFSQRRPTYARRLFARLLRGRDEIAAWACQQAMQTFVQSGNEDRAGAWLESCGGAERGVVAYGQGCLLRRSGAARPARRLLQQAEAWPSTRWPARLELVRLAAAAGRSDDAGRQLRAIRRHYERLPGGAWGLAAGRAQEAELAVQTLDLEAAIAHAGSARRMREDLADPLGVGFVLQTEAKAHYLLADYVAAMEALRRALALHITHGHLLEVATCYNNIGLWHLDLSDPESARESFAASLRYLRRLRDRRRQGIVLANLGNASQQLHDMVACERYYRRALGLLAGRRGLDAYGIAVAELAEARTRNGKPSEALAALAAVSPVERRRMGAHTRAVLAVESARAHLGRAEPARALALSARVRERMPQRGASAKAQLLPGLRADTVHAQALLATGRQGEAVAAARRLCRRIDALRSRQASPDVRMGLVEANRDAQDTLVQAVLGEQGWLAAWRVVTGLKARELASPGRAARLGRDTALIEFHVARDRTQVFSRCRGGTGFHETGFTESRLVRTVERLLRPLQGPETAADDALARLEDFDLDLSARLHGALLAPALAQLPADVRRLIIVPDGSLHALPFELLVMHTARRRPRSYPSLARFDEPCYLGERYVVSYALSSRLLRPGDQADRPRRFLGLAYSPRRPAALPTPEGSMPLTPLPGVARELAAIAPSFADATVRIGRRATRASYVASAPRQDVIHIAAHARSDARAPGLSGVVVAPERAGEGISYMSADAIRNTRLRAALVTLSACDTGRGRLRAKEGILGLARAFLEAGATAVLASLWPVDDQATRELMCAFYLRWHAGSDPARALAGAKRDMRNRCDRHLFPTRAHPFFWAPFVLIDHRLVTLPVRSSAFAALA